MRATNRHGRRARSGLTTGVAVAAAGVLVGMMGVAPAQASSMARAQDGEVRDRGTTVRTSPGGVRTRTGPPISRPVTTVNPNNTSNPATPPQSPPTRTPRHAPERPRTTHGPDSPIGPPTHRPRTGRPGGPEFIHVPAPSTEGLKFKTSPFSTVGGTHCKFVPNAGDHQKGHKGWSFVIKGSSLGLAKDLICVSTGHWRSFGFWGPIYYPYGWHWRHGPRYSSWARYWGPIDGQLSPGYAPQVPPADPVPEEPARDLTPFERGYVALQRGASQAAADHFRVHLSEEPGDAEAMRLLGVALIDSGRIDDGVSVIRLAYQEDPSLAGRPIGRDAVGDDTRRLRRMVVNTVRRAHRLESASAWLAVTVLMQAEERDRVAERMLERAIEAYLDEEIAREFRVALRR